MLPQTVFVLDTGIQAKHAWFQPGQVSHGFDFERTLQGLDFDDEVKTQRSTIQFYTSLHDM